MNINIMRLRDQIPGLGRRPTNATDGSACFDFYYDGESTEVLPGENLYVSSGFAFEIPSGYAMFLFSRSGQTKSGIRLANCVGVIDSDYRGDVIGCLHNDGTLPFVLRPGDKFMQGQIQKAPKVYFTEVEELSSTARGDGGFGSTDGAVSTLGSTESLDTEPSATTGDGLHTVTVSGPTFWEIVNSLTQSGKRSLIGDDGAITGIRVVRG